jgi:hypothetical protein
MQRLIMINSGKSLVGMMEPSAFLAIFPYAFLASFPVFGIVIVTKWQLDDRKRKKAGRLAVSSSRL